MTSSEEERRAHRDVSASNLDRGKVPEEHVHHGHGHGHAHAGHGHGVPPAAGFVESACFSEQRSELPAGAGRGKTLFFDMQSGIAGDMTLAALVDLGVPLSAIRSAIDALDLGAIELRVRTGYAGAIGCRHLTVEYPEQHEERTFREIRKLIQGSSLDDATKDLSIVIFRKLAEAEAAVHRTSPDEVHFHEVGAVDAIVDIVGAARAITYLGATVKASPVPLGRGHVDCRHGRIPLPAPATLLCLRGVPTEDAGLAAELVTPTGAAIIASVATEFGQWFSMTPQIVGWGAGTRGLGDRPNALRVILGEDLPSLAPAKWVLLEANIDDMTGEWAAFAIERLIQRGAVDAWVSPATMKKGRPAFVFSALAPVSLAQELSTALLEETTSIGVRQIPVSRQELPRRAGSVMTPWGEVRVKISELPGGRTRMKPESTDLLRIAEEAQVSPEEVRLAVLDVYTRTRE